MTQDFSTEQKEQLLRGSELFSALDAEALSQVAALARQLDFAGGHYIVRQGEIGTGFYVVVNGRVQVSRDNEIVDELGPGETFGELSILDQMPRTATVKTLEPTTCLALASWELTHLLEERPKVTLALLREVVKRMRPYLHKSHRH